MSRPKPPVRRHFYPRPPRGGRQDLQVVFRNRMHFYPRPPRGGRRQRSCTNLCIKQFLSTPSARRATTAQLHQSLHQAISIHALREEGDHRPVRFRDCPQNFYPRPPRGGRHALLGVVFIKLVFLSTPSARRATAVGHVVLDYVRFLSTPSARRATPAGVLARWSIRFLSTPSARRATDQCRKVVRIMQISIHALREEGDTMATTIEELRKEFLSTPSARRATAVGGILLRRVQDFYPRPPRGGRRGRAWASAPLLYFYPRPPRGGRRIIAASLFAFSIFLSTPSARRATFLFLGSYLNTPISIHALREEGDHISPFLSVIQSHFYPRPPRGGRPLAVWPLLAVAIFLSTPSARRATPTFCSSWASTRFLSTPSARRATRSPPQLRDF